MSLILMSDFSIYLFLSQIKWFFFSPKIQRLFFWGPGRERCHFNNYRGSIFLSTPSTLSSHLAYRVSYAIMESHSAHVGARLSTSSGQKQYLTGFLEFIQQLNWCLEKNMHPKNYCCLEWQWADFISCKASCIILDISKY